MEPAATRRAEICAKLTVDLVRVTMLAFERQGDFEATAGEVLLGAAVFMAQAQGRPMTAAKVATYIGIARSTAIRWLNQMRGRNMLVVNEDGQWFANNGTPKYQALLSEIASEKTRLIHRAAAELSKLDGRTVAYGGSDK